MGRSSSSPTTWCRGADRRQVAVMYAGRIVEYGNVRYVLMNPKPIRTRWACWLDHPWRPVARHQIEAIRAAADMRGLPRLCFAPPASTRTRPVRRCAPAEDDCPRRLTCCFQGAT